MSYSFFCPTRISFTIDSFTQTDEKLKFDTDPDLFKKKAKAVIALHLYNNDDKELDPDNICILALTKRSTCETIKKFGGVNAKYLFIKTIELLIEEKITTKDDMFKYLLNEIKENELLTYALNLVYHNGAQRIIDTTVNGGEFLAAYCYALSCFVNNDNKPVEAINEAKDVSSLFCFDRMLDLIFELTCCMVASSYGNAFIVYDPSAVDDAYRTLFD
jgi:hypothetical protein